MQQKDKIVISPRKNIVLVRVQNDRGAVNMILDRKPHIYPSLDFSLFNYFEKSEKRNDKNIYLINGNCGIRLIDELKKKGKIKYHEINLVEIRKLLSTLDFDYHIFQEIDLTKY